MAKTIAFDVPFKMNEKVRATEDLPGVPAGTEGKVQVANGFRWRRYWVKFENGVVLGQVDHHKLVRSRDWDRWQAEREKAAAAPVAAASGNGDSGGGEADAGGGVTVNGVVVPQRLLDRSAAARARLAG